MALNSVRDYASKWIQANERVCTEPFIDLHRVRPFLVSRTVPH